MKQRFPFVILSVLIIVSIFLGACAPKAQPAQDAASTAAATEAQAEVTEAGASTEPVTITFWHGYNAVSYTHLTLPTN
jgi:Na+-transporting methylmalonyl-CoA/oxaloacetate decarboxylase gamma subunit